MEDKEGKVHGANSETLPGIYIMLRGRMRGRLSKDQSTAVTTRSQPTRTERFENRYITTGAAAQAAPSRFWCLRGDRGGGISELYEKRAVDPLPGILTGAIQ